MSCLNGESGKSCESINFRCVVCPRTTSENAEIKGNTDLEKAKLAEDKRKKTATNKAKTVGTSGFGVAVCVAFILVFIVIANSNPGSGDTSPKPVITPTSPKRAVTPEITNTPIKKKISPSTIKNIKPSRQETFELNDGFFAPMAYKQYVRPMKTSNGWEVRIDEFTMFSDPVKGAYYTKAEFEQEALIRFVKGAVTAGVATISNKNTSDYPAGQLGRGNGIYWDGKYLYDTSGITQAMHEGRYNPPYRDFRLAMAATRNSEGIVAANVVDGNKVAAAIFGRITDKQAYKMAQRLHYFDQDKYLTLAKARANIPQTDQILADIKDRLDGPFHYFTLGSARRNDPWDLKQEYLKKRQGPYTKRMKQIESGD